MIKTDKYEEVKNLVLDYHHYFRINDDYGWGWRNYSTVSRAGGA